MKVIRDALIMPLEGTMDAFTGGVFDSDGEFMADSVIYRGRALELREHCSKPSVMRPFCSPRKIWKP